MTMLPKVAGFDLGDDAVAVSVDGHAARLSLAPLAGAPVAVERFAAGTIETRAARAVLRLDGRDRRGWLLDEQVRLPSGSAGFAADHFGRFQYFVLAASDGFHVIKDEGSAARRHALRFSSEGRVDELKGFGFEERRRGHDATSGRADVPEAWRIDLRAWGRAFTLESGAGQTGHGRAEARPRPLYRQASVSGVDREGAAVHGMVELVLER